MPHRSTRVIVIGAGVGGLAAAIELASQGVAVELLERAEHLGGKMRTLLPGTQPIDGGPTVLTLREVFDTLFARSGARLDDHLTLERSRVLAHHRWPDGSSFDLHADPQDTAAAIGRLAGAAEAARFIRFAAQAARVWRTLGPHFVEVERPTAAALVGRAGIPALLGIGAFSTLADALARRFSDPRLRQLFGRYATYCGTSPYRAPATLMLVAHVEQRGVWRVRGGMAALAAAMAARAAALGVRIRPGCEAVAILARDGRASGVRLADGEECAADAVVAAGDIRALAAGLLGVPARAAVPRPPPRRSLSAVTWAVEGRVPPDAALARHNVFFPGDPAAEFAAIDAGCLPAAPTVYVCAQDRGEPERRPDAGPERFLCLVNAPATNGIGADALAKCGEAVRATLRRRGVPIEPVCEPMVTTPADWAHLYPGTAGALYGQPTEGPWGSFRRPGGRSRLPGLYLAGGSVHPGPGLPMAAISGRLAASALMADLASTRPFRRAATSGGTSMRPAMTGASA